MMHIFKFIFLTLCVFSQVHASDTETLNNLKDYLSNRKQQMASKINLYCIRHKYIYKPEEKYWFYQGKAEAFDEIETYLYLYEKHNMDNKDDSLISPSII